MATLLCFFGTPAFCSLPRPVLSASLSSLQKTRTIQCPRPLVFHSRDQQNLISALKSLIPVPGRQRLTAQPRSGVTPPISYIQGARVMWWPGSEWNPPAPKSIMNGLFSMKTPTKPVEEVPSFLSPHSPLSAAFLSFPTLCHHCSYKHLIHPPHTYKLLVYFHASHSLCKNIGHRLNKYLKS